MEMALVVGLLCVGAALGALIVVAWMSDRRPIIDQFREIHGGEDDLERRIRRLQ